MVGRLIHSRLPRTLTPTDSYIVPKEVGKVGNQSSDFLKPIAERKGNISSFFAKPAKSTASEGKNTQKSPSASAGTSAKPDKPSSGDESAKAKAIKDDAVEVVKEEDLALNPDEVDKVQTRSSSRRSERSAGKESKPIILDEDESTKHKPKKGKQSEPIVLDDESDEDKPMPRSNSKRKRQPNSTAKDRRPDKKARKEAEEDTDGEGNEKLTSFFETVDDA